MGIQISWSNLSQVKPFQDQEESGKSEGEPPTPTRIPSTDDAYCVFATRSVPVVVSHFKAEGEEYLTGNDFSVWLAHARGQYRSAAWRYARAAICNLLMRAQTIVNEQIDNPTSEADAIEAKAKFEELSEALKKMKSIKWSNHFANEGKTVRQRSKELPDRTSSAKKKFVPADFLMDMTEFTKKETRGEWIRRAIAMCWATLFTGLRPCEWRNASITRESNGSLDLCVFNAKATNGRGTGPTRTIVVEGKTACSYVRQQLKVVADWIEETKFTGGNDEFKKTYEMRCAEALRTTQIKRYGKILNVTPYSFRHQFTANCKSNGVSKEELARLMGHESIETAGSHYGRRRKGYSGKNGVKIDFASKEQMTKEILAALQAVHVKSPQMAASQRVASAAKPSPSSSPTIKSQI